MKIWSYACAGLAVVLGCAMCYVVGFTYRDMLCGIEHCGYSAPAEIAFLYAIPFAAAIICCILLAIRLYPKEK